MEDPPRPLPTDVSLVFPPHPVWVRTARETVRTLLTASGHPELTDTAVLLTSEAVTNAINACAAKHCTTPVTLHAGWADPARLRVLIHDEAPGRPTCRTPTHHDEDGRGIQLISYGADAWGVCTHGLGRGKATWFELAARRAVATAIDVTSDILDSREDILEVRS
ncbi:ATP-binding protein [Streptomyces sp. NBC_00878]|uniref:ATP-binding protein n=1 Tax=Streptomyces sp. NBC_00878 TaxID=2975854 RepID=UPI00225284C1|nr:ATP-binding protein [Streptomyces sp. NBC_00878]MCX4908466.1 ATP-binding protein [Streptomyces sp. NBC_00878]